MWVQDWESGTCASVLALEQIISLWNCKVRRTFAYLLPNCTNYQKSVEHSEESKIIKKLKIPPCSLFTLPKQDCGL